MPDDVHFTVEYDDAEARKRFEQLAVLLSDLRPFWPMLRHLFVGWMSEQFDTEGAFGGHAWPALSSAYEARKAVRYPGKSILIATGDLKRAATSPVQTEATATSLTLVIDDSAMLHGGKTARAVSQFHQDGTAKMQPRPIVFGDPLPGDAEREIEEAMGQYAEDVIGRLFGRVADTTSA